MPVSYTHLDVYKRQHLFKLHTMKAYAFLLAGENFRALPTTVGGNALPANEQLQLAKTTLDKALTYAKNNHEDVYKRQWLSQPN